MTRKVRAETKRNKAEAMRQLFAVTNEKGWTNRQVADTLGVDPSTVSKWRGGAPVGAPIGRIYETLAAIRGGMSTRTPLSGRSKRDSSPKLAVAANGQWQEREQKLLLAAIDERNRLFESPPPSASNGRPSRNLIAALELVLEHLDDDVVLAEAKRRGLLAADLSSASTANLLAEIDRRLR